MLTAMKFSSLAAVACLSLLAAACSSPTVQAPNTVPAPTAAPPLAPTAVARPIQAASATVAPQSATTSSTAATKLVIDQSVSQARYHAHEQLVGKTLPSEAVGTSKSVSGSLVLGTDGTVQADQSTISVDLSKLQSDES